MTITVASQDTLGVVSRKEYRVLTLRVCSTCTPLEGGSEKSQHSTNDTDTRSQQQTPLLQIWGKAISPPQFSPHTLFLYVPHQIPYVPYILPKSTHKTYSVSLPRDIDASPLKTSSLFSLSGTVDHTMIILLITANIYL